MKKIIFPILIILIVFVAGCIGINNLSKNTLHAEVLPGYDLENNFDPANPSYYYVYVKNTDNYSWHNVSIILDDKYFCLLSESLEPSDWIIDYITGCFDNERNTMPDTKPSKVEIRASEGNGVWQLSNVSLMNDDEAKCTQTGGTVTTNLCCKSGGDFPNSCLIGACGCSPDNSHEVKACDCGPDKCFDNTNGCTPSAPEQFSCENNDECLATCAYGCVNKIWMGNRPECLMWINFECRCIDNNCQNISKEQSCIESGGQVTIGRCGFDFPNTCSVGDCAACFPDPNAPECKDVNTCDCGDIDEKCFNGVRCVPSQQ